MSAANPAASLPRMRSALRHEGEREVPFHAHETAELIYVVKGHIWIDVAGASLEGRPGDLIVSPARVPHNQRREGFWSTICILFQGGEAQLSSAPRVLAMRGDALLRRWLEDLCGLYDAHARIADPVADALLLAVLTRAALAEDRRRAREALHPRLAEALAFLEARPNQVVAAQELARAAHASYSHLSALFRARFGHGPLQHHQRLRLERARKLLLNPYAAVREVAREAGYDDVNYFVRQFRKAYGIAPGRWRRREIAAEA